MKYALILLTCALQAAAQTDSLPANPLPAQPDSARIHTRYSYETQYITATLALLKDSTFQYTFTSPHSWKVEAGEWRIRRNEVLVLKVQSSSTSKKPEPRNPAGRRRLLCTNYQLTTKFMKMQRDMSLRFRYLLRPPIVPDLGVPQCNFKEDSLAVAKWNIECKCKDLVIHGRFTDSLKAHVPGATAKTVFYYYPLLPKEGETGIYHYGDRRHNSGLFIFDGTKISLLDSFPTDQKLATLALNWKEKNQVADKLRDADPKLLTKIFAAPPKKRCDFEQLDYSVLKETIACGCNDIVSEGRFTDSIRILLNTYPKEPFFYYPLWKGQGEKGLYHVWGKNKYNRLFIFDGVKLTMLTKNPFDNGNSKKDTPEITELKKHFTDQQIARMEWKFNKIENRRALE